MIFHEFSECVVIPMIGQDNTLRYCDIMSNDFHVGCVRYDSGLNTWALNLSSYNIEITPEFHRKIYSRLFVLQKDEYQSQNT